MWNVCGILKCENTSICEKVAKCEKNINAKCENLRQALKKNDSKCEKIRLSKCINILTLNVLKSTLYVQTLFSTPVKYFYPGGDISTPVEIFSQG